MVYHLCLHFCRLFYVFFNYNVIQGCFLLIISYLLDNFFLLNHLYFIYYKSEIFSRNICLKKVRIVLSTCSLDIFFLWTGRSSYTFITGVEWVTCWRKGVYLSENFPEEAENEATTYGISSFIALSCKYLYRI